MIEIIYGKHTYGEIKPFGSIRGKITVGKYCSISGEVRAFMFDSHNTKNISTFPFGHPAMPITKLIKDKSFFQNEPYRERTKKRITIGNDVWIGYGATIFTGVTIGDGAVIGAFSLITKDVPPYTVVVGNCREVKKRFSDDEIKFLLNLKWWDFTDEEVVDITPLLLSPHISKLRRKYEAF